METQFDAIVVGSGATGGVAAKQLCEAGLKVLVVEAGPSLKGPRSYGDPVTNLAKQLKQRWFTHAQHVQERHGGYWETNPDLYTDDKQNPYATPTDRPYRWVRGRQVGGRSHTWGGVLLRFSDYEFKAASRDGWGVDWPLTSAELAPHYAMLERFFQAYGGRDGLPQLPDGDFVGARPFSPGEELFAKTVEQRFGRRLVGSRGIRAGRYAAKGEQYSRLSSSGSTLIAAQRTGNLTLQSGAIVARLLMRDGRAEGVEWVDAATRTYSGANARLVFLCASTIESLRILMMSGVGDSSGLLGRGLMDHIVVNTYFRMPGIRDVEGYELLGSDGSMVPRYQNLDGQQRAAHLRGFGFWGGINRLRFPSLLRRQKDVAFGFYAGMGETLPDDGNFVRLDASLKDTWGLPAPFISCRWTDNDVRLAQQMTHDGAEMVEAAGGVVTPLTELVRTPMIEGFMKTMEQEWKMTTPGLFVHEVGGARMGLDPKTSVTSPYCRLWDAKNVYVTDGACWVSSGWQNPTHTEMALTARAAEHAVSALRRFEL
ncbi:MAG: GMC family oxidoreductase [Archangiaceae bacterium]|nr:GMC family oxidoreductase [Archangiaceae bacterium]